MTAMPSIPGGLTWDPQDRLIETDLSGGGVVYYVYDSAGIRVRKVWVNQSGTTSKERYYLGAWETYRETTDLLGTPTLDLERETLHVDDAAGAACLIETKTVESATPIGSPDSVLRYQHHNHLGTATLELTGDAEVISYEEYHPYGTSSYRAANSGVDVSPKRYRYTGKERDEETGLYYHEARYYACWLGRWASTDPAEGLVDGPNRFQYTRGGPTVCNDKSGMTGEVPSILLSVSFENREFGKYIVEENNGDGPAAADLLEPYFAGYERISRAEFDKIETAWQNISNGTGSIVIDDQAGIYGEFRQPVLDAIGTLLSKPEGRRLVLELADKSAAANMRVKISPGHRAQEWVTPTGVEIQLRPPGQDIYMSPRSPFFILAAHELIHGLHDVKGTTKPKLPDEERATTVQRRGSTDPTEQSIRQEHSLPPRLKHGATLPYPPLVRVRP